MHPQHVLPRHVVAVQRDRARRGCPPPPVPLPQRGPWRPALPWEPELSSAECAWHSGSGHTVCGPSFCGDSKAAESCCSKVQIQTAEAAKRREERSPEMCSASSCLVVPPVLPSAAVLLQPLSRQLPRPGCCSADQHHGMAWHGRMEALMAQENP